MRTKAITITAAIGLAGAIGAMAQVYSQNAVGYYNVALGGGYTMIANQLNNGDNNLNTILPGPLPDGSRILKWDGATQLFAKDQVYVADGPPGEKWYDPETFELSTTTLSPGEGAFIDILPGNTANITLVGEVPQGDLALGLAPNLAIISQLTPQEIGLNATGFPAGEGDRVLFWSNAAQRFTVELTYVAEGLAWFNLETFEEIDPTPALGESLFYDRQVASGSTTWTRTFSVNPQP